MRGSSACGNPVRLLQKPRLGFGGACGAGGRSWGWNLRVSGGRTQISRVPEVEEGSLDPSPRAMWSQRKGRSTVVTLTCLLVMTITGVCHSRGAGQESPQVQKACGGASQDPQAGAEGGSERSRGS